MKKIYSLGVNPTTWFNFSNHLNILDSKITSYQDFLNYFKPTYNILNESIYVCDTITLENRITSPVNATPE
jgi:hypothetical protein